MGSNKTAISVGEYFLKKKIFSIPAYQRCYKWGVKGSSGKSCTERLIEDILKAKEYNRETYFIQGVTVVEEDNEIILVDGQQRTTTLFLLFIYLRDYLSENEKIEDYILIDSQPRIRYDIRRQTHKYIENLIGLHEEIDRDYYETEYQDCYYIRQSLNQIDHLLCNYEKKEFFEYIINNVKLFFITIDGDKAYQIFSMLNGAKAQMTVEELVKAEMLNKISRINEKDSEWEINQRRGQYAREWDRWLYFWNRPDVKDLFGAPKRPLGWLIEYLYNVETNDTPKWDATDTPTLFKLICDRFLPTTKKAKETFYKLRNCQKHFEDLFSNPVSYNYVGLAMQEHSQNLSVIEKIKLFAENYKDHNLLRKNAYLIILGATLSEIRNEKEDELIQKVRDLVGKLSSNDVYHKHSEETFLQLLRINIDKDNQLEINKEQGRKFNFSLYKDRSLEHIHPKSKVYRIKEDGSFIQMNVDVPRENLTQNDVKGWLCKQNFLDNTSEHCIGNMALLSTPNNSEFKDRLFDGKKEKFFSLDPEVDFESRAFQHTVLLFTKKQWSYNEILENRNATLDDIKNAYKSIGIWKAEDTTK